MAWILSCGALQVLIQLRWALIEPLSAIYHTTFLVFNQSRLGVGAVCSVATCLIRFSSGQVLLVRCIDKICLLIDVRESALRLGHLRLRILGILRWLNLDIERCVVFVVNDGWEYASHHFGGLCLPACCLCLLSLVSKDTSWFSLLIWAQQRITHIQLRRTRYSSCSNQGLLAIGIAIHNQVEILASLLERSCVSQLLLRLL